MILARLMARRHRALLLLWPVLLIALCAGTVSAYQSTYPTPALRHAAVQLAQANTATTLLYGNLPDPGTPGQMFAWEIGAFATVLAALMAVLTTVALTRAAEDDGTLELVRACGIAPRTPLRTALAIVCAVAALLAVGCTLGAGVHAGRVDGVTWSGAATLGAALGLTFLLVAALTAALAQVLPSAAGARGLGLAAVGAAFAGRSVADTRAIGWLNWLSPLGLRATVRPFAGNRWWVLALDLVVAMVLLRLAGWLHRRREYRAGLLRHRDRLAARLPVHSVFGLAARLTGRQVLGWTIAVAAIGTLFSAMGSGAAELSRSDELGGFLGAQLGAGDPIAGYFAYCGTVTGIVVAAFTVLAVLRSRHDEAAGLTDHVLAAGVRRWMPLASQATVAATGSVLILAATGALTALVAPAVIDGPHVAAQSFGYIIGQWPAALAAAGWTTLLVGRWPRMTWLAWIPLVASAALALLGPLLNMSRSVRDLGLFQHAPDISAPGPAYGGQVVLLAVAAGCTLAGIVATTRRDISTG